LVNYRHRYTGEELGRIERSIRGKNAYVLFNNLAMKEDAESFLRMVGEGPQTNVKD
jgi:uncharacterized protein YecE (DUF72 family)